MEVGAAPADRGRGTGAGWLRERGVLAVLMSERQESLNTQLANAVAAVALATDRLLLKVRDTEAARREETDARNKVNEAQKHFDELVAMVKKSAPRDTDWRRPVGVSAQSGA